MWSIKQKLRIKIVALKLCPLTNSKYLKKIDVFHFALKSFIACVIPLIPTSHPSLSLCADAPSPPQKLRVNEVQRDSVSIAWDHSESDGGSPLTNYIIEKKEQWKSTWAHVDRVGSLAIFSRLVL